MTDPDTLRALRALTDPTPEQLREASDLALLARGWRQDVWPVRGLRYWTSPEGNVFYDDERPRPCASIDDAVRWMVPKGWAYHMHDIPFRGYKGASVGNGEDIATQETVSEEAPMALALTIAGLAATLVEGEK